jgi:hypothetical protein
MEVQKGTDGKVLCNVVSAFKVHTPSAGSVREIVSQWYVELPIYIKVAVERYLGFGG